MTEIYTLTAKTSFGDCIEISKSNDLKICLSVMHQLMMNPKGYTGYIIWRNNTSIIISVTDFRF